MQILRSIEVNASAPPPINSNILAVLVWIASSAAAACDFHGGATVKRSAPKAAHHHVLQLGVLIEPIFRTFTAETRLFDAAKRRDLGRQNPFVDADHAALQ